jgi:ADP-heptose:LPS heptosyltransferase
MHLTGTEVEKIAIFRALQLGDMLCVIPAVRALKEAFPQASLTLIGLPWSKFMVNRFPHYFNEHIVFPGHPGLPEQDPDVLVLPEFFTVVQQQNFSLLVQMHGSGNIVNSLMACCNAAILAGYYTPGTYKPSSYFIPYPGSIHEIHRHLALISALGIDSDNDELEFPIFNEDLQELREHQLSLLPGSYVCIHPGARDRERQWGLINFARIADHCAEQGYQVVITGSEEETDLADQTASFMKFPSINAAGKTSIGGVAALISNAKALVSNCTGVAHIAAALKKRSLVISLNEEPWRWAPLNKDLHTTIEWHESLDPEDVMGMLDHVLFDASLYGDHGI